MNQRSLEVVLHLVERFRGREDHGIGLGACPRGVPIIEPTSVAVVDDERVHVIVREVVDADSPFVTSDSSAERRDGVSRRGPTHVTPKQEG